MGWGAVFGVELEEWGLGVVRNYLVDALRFMAFASISEVVICEFSND